MGIVEEWALQQVIQRPGAPKYIPQYNIPGKPGLYPGPGGMARDPKTGRFITPLDVFGPKFKASSQVKSLQVQVEREMKEFGLDITGFITDNDVPTLEQWRAYISMCREYITLHGGNIIGDAVKIEYFTRGQGKWKHLAPETISRKAELSRDNPHRFPPSFIPHPLARATDYGVSTANWKQYLSIRGFKYNQYLSAIPRYATADAVAFMAPKARHLGSATTQTYNDIVKNVDTRKLIDPIRGLGPSTGMAVTSIPRYYTAIQVTGVVEAFRYTPYTLYQESGYYNVLAGKRVGARPFIARGIFEGLKRIAHLFNTYHQHGQKVFEKQYKRSMAGVIRDSDKLVKIYSAIGRNALKAAIDGKQGDSLPHHYSMFDDSRKVDEVRISIRSLFGNHLIWWFLPPSKWWHYVGVMDDLRSLAIGGVWSLGSIQAMVQQMTLGILGARMGSPIPFTRKSRRRKFRKGLYSRAGYHREYVGGSNR